MAYCTKCGSQVADGIKFCTSCGALMSGAAAPTNTPQPTPSYTAPQPTPSYTAQPTPMRGESIPQPGSKYEPISAGGFFGIMFLMALPVINLLLLILWACGGCRKVNKQNFAKAMLLWILVGIVFSVLFGVVISIFFAGSGGLEGIKNYIFSIIAGAPVE